MYHFEANNLRCFSASMAQFNGLLGAAAHGAELPSGSKSLRSSSSAWRSVAFVVHHANRGGRLPIWHGVGGSTANWQLALHHAPRRMASPGASPVFLLVSGFWRALAKGTAWADLLRAGRKFPALLGLARK